MTAPPGVLGGRARPGGLGGRALHVLGELGDCQAGGGGTRAKARNSVGAGFRPWPGAGHRCDQLSWPAVVPLIGFNRPRAECQLLVE